MRCAIRALAAKQIRYQEIKKDLHRLRGEVKEENPQRVTIYVPPGMRREEFMLRAAQEWERIARLAAHRR